MADTPPPEREPLHQPGTPGPNGQKPPESPRGPLRALFASLRRPAPLAALGLAAVFLLLLGLSLRSGPETAPPESPAPRAAIPDVPVIRDAATEADSEYAPAGSMEAGVRAVDQALVAGLHALSVDPANIAFVDVHQETHAGERFTVQTLRLPGGVSASELIRALREALPEVRYAVRPGDGGEIVVSVDGLPTHHLVNVAPPLAPSAKGPKLVLVIDDMGENMTVARDLARLPVPVAFAVWPNASHAAEVRALARRKGLPLLVHLPMEPLSYPENDPGRDALFVRMNDQELDRTIQADLDKVPEAVGVNNHMGSRFTENAHGMTLLLRELKRRGLFFLDSRTTPRSVGRAVARAERLPYYGRDVFLDNSLAVPDIVLQLRKAERLAMRHGAAIAIGHPHPQTAQAIAQWLRGLDASVRVVPLTALAPQ